MADYTNFRGKFCNEINHSVYYSLAKCVNRAIKTTFQLVGKPYSANTLHANSDSSM